MNPQTETLVETIPPDLVTRSWWNYIYVVGGSLAIFCTALSVVTWYHSGFLACLGISILLWSWSSFLVIGSANGIHQKLYKQVPTVRLCDDELHVQYGDRHLVANVQDCHLHLGQACSMRLVGGVKFYCWQPVILIDFPPFWNPRLGMRRPTSNIIAVGYTSEMKAKWERVLVLKLYQ